MPTYITQAEGSNRQLFSAGKDLANQPIDRPTDWAGLEIDNPPTEKDSLFRHFRRWKRPKSRVEELEGEVKKSPKNDLQPRDQLPFPLFPSLWSKKAPFCTSIGREMERVSVKQLLEIKSVPSRRQSCWPGFFSDWKETSRQGSADRASQLMHSYTTFSEKRYCSNECDRGTWNAVFSQRMGPN